MGATIGGMHSPGSEKPRAAAVTSLAALAERALAGDEPAFEELYRRLDGGLQRFLSRRGGTTGELVEELAQRTWVAVWGALHAGRYDPRRSAFSTFLYAVGYKVWLQHRRQARTGPQPLDDVEGLLDGLLHDLNDPADALDLGELLDAVRACIASHATAGALTADERAVLQGVTAGESERALAARLGVAASTINARKASIYGKLRECLARKGFGPPAGERGGLPGG
jgi:RNA polymerase sigma factor (sigma-70 family)